MDIKAAFKLFDIRGQYPQVVDERLAYVLGKALIQWKKPKKVLVCCDTRESSPSLKEFLSDGFGNSDVTVYDLGEAPLPLFNFAMTRADYDLGVMVTASHVSEDENGFKMVTKGPTPLDEKEITDIQKILEYYQDDPIVVPRVEIKKVNYSDAYAKELLKIIKQEKPKIKISVDATKSVVLTTVMTLFQELGANFHLVNSNHSGNPLIEINRRALQKDVVETKSDLGIMWDSDGDRVVFIDRQGEMIPMSFVLGILAVSEIKQSVTKKVAIDVRAGLVVRDLVTEAGGEMLILPAWSTYIKFAMQQDKEIVFGGETSGHFIFRDFFNIDDGILAAFKFIRLFEAGYIEEKLQELGKRYFELPEKNIPFQQEKSVNALEKLTEYYRSKNYLVSIEDGLTVFGSNFKFNVRESVTEPLLRLNIESLDEKTADDIVHQIENQVKS